MEKKTISIVAAVLAVALVVVGILFVQQKQSAENLQALQAELNAEIDALNAQVDEKAAEIEALNVDAADKDSQIEALNADVADKSSQIDALNADVADKSSQIDALNADVADKSSQIDTLNADVADKSSQIEALNADVSDKSQKLEAMNADMTELNSQIQALSANSTDQAATVESLTAELEQLRQSTAKPEIPDSIPGTYSTTREFLYAMEQADYSYTYMGIDGDGDETITTDFSCAGHSVTIWLWFSSDCESVMMRVWDVIAYNALAKNAVCTVCDELNYSYRYVCFYMEGDNTVTMSMDFIVRPDGNAGDIVLDGLLTSLAVLEYAYPNLEPYAA